MTFFWGYGRSIPNHKPLYKFLWRPSDSPFPRGRRCPSKIGTVRCWDDGEILWVNSIYQGANRENCDSVCAMAGASASDYKCKSFTWPGDKFAKVSEIMRNFGNLQCKEPPPQCGHSSYAMSVHAATQTCWAPSKSTIDCKAMYGFPAGSQQLNENQNRGICGHSHDLNYVCPCTPGCGTRAGPQYCYHENKIVCDW